MRKFCNHTVLILACFALLYLLSCGIPPAQSTKPVKTSQVSAAQKAHQQRSRLAEADCSGTRPGTTGTLVADTGLRPNPGGFSFPNYSDEYPYGDLTIEDARMMFGDQVCKSIQDGKCIPTSPAQKWVRDINAAMQVGHCEGMAVLSARLFLDPQQLQNYGQPNTFVLAPVNQALMRSISYYWAMQTLEPVRSEFMKFQEKTPSEILATLIDAMRTGRDFYTLGLYGQSGGHAVTPYAIEDLGQGLFYVHVYDNNYPCTYKYVEIDTTTETWRYAGGARNPEEDAAPWQGGKGTLDLTSLSVRQQPLECPFCQDPDTGCEAANKGLTIVLTGKGSALSATNQLGQTIRIEGDQLINQIPGAALFRLKSAETGNPSIGKGALMVLPPEEEYTVDITGEQNTQPENAEIAVFQACKGFGVKGITLQPQQRDQLIIAQGRTFRYRSDDGEELHLEMAVYDPDGSDGLYEVSDLELLEGAGFEIEIDPETGEIFFSDDDPELEDFDLDIILIDEDGEISHLSYDDIDVGDDGQAVWLMTEDGEFELEIDSDSDGLIDDLDFDDDEDGVPDDEDIDDDGDDILDVEDDDELLKEVDDQGDFETEYLLEDEDYEDLLGEDSGAEDFEDEAFPEEDYDDEDSGDSDTDDAEDDGSDDTSDNDSSDDSSDDSGDDSSDDSGDDSSDDSGDDSDGDSGDDSSDDSSDDSGDSGDDSSDDSGDDGGDE